MTPAQRFAANLRRLRTEAGHSQEDLSYLAGINRVQVGTYECGEVTPRATAVVKLAGALGATPNDLLAGIEWNPGVYEAGRLEIGGDA